MIQPEIIFEDDDILVINKPSGWITNDASTTKNQPVLQSFVREHLGITKDKEAENDSFKARDGVVHRLDKETSGCIVVAKNEASFKNLQNQFKDRVVKKKYEALVHGAVEPGVGIVDAPVGRLPWRRDRFGVLPGGRSADTEYETIGKYKDDRGEYTLLLLSPQTGRTHQIRIHMKHIGHPLVSDEFYAGRKTARDDRMWCPRLFLHAREITFVHPGSGGKVTYDAKLHSDLQEALNKLSKLN